MPYTYPHAAVTKRRSEHSSSGMIRREPATQYHVIGASIRGASHARAGLPNQDAIALHNPAPDADYAALAIADGHGSSRYVRSHTGAKLAVRATLAVMADFAQRHAAGFSLPVIRRQAAEEMPRTIARAWRERVNDHLDAHPLTDDERQLLPDRWFDADPENVSAAVYGATLLGALVTQKYLFLLQLGDGDILSVGPDHQVTVPPLPHDPRLIANETTSLSGSTAWQDMRTYFLPFEDHPPALVLLATDGYANSFSDVEGFQQAGTDLLDALVISGPTKVARQLPGWLHQTSAAGSGDDITVGLVYRR